MQQPDSWNVSEEIRYVWDGLQSCQEISVLHHLPCHPDVLVLQVGETLDLLHLTRGFIGGQPRPDFFSSLELKVFQWKIKSFVLKLTQHLVSVEHEKS